MNRSHDETSQALLAAAHRLLADDGPEALTVRRIANEAGMSTMNVYSRFGGKDGVIDELYVDGPQRLAAALRSVPDTGKATDDIMKLAQTYRDFALANPTYYGIMFRATVPGFEPTPESVEIALTSLNFFVERLQGAQQAGFIRADVETTAIAAAFWANCHGLVSLELDEVGDEYVSWPEIFEHGVRATIAGLHPAAQSIAAG